MTDSTAPSIFDRTRYKVCQHGTLVGQTCDSCAEIAIAAQGIADQARELAKAIRDFAALETGTVEWAEEGEYKGQVADGLADSFDAVSGWAFRSAEGHRGWKR
jgi:hypothetical protein